MNGVLIPLWGRSELSTKVLAQWADTSPESDLHLCCVLSPEDPDPPVVPDRFNIVFFPNDDMRAKWQAGLDSMRGQVDAVMVMGSDDVADAAYIDSAFRLCHDTGAACSSSIVFCDPGTDRAFEARYRTVFAGAAYSAGLLDRMDWQLFTEADSPNPDHSTIHRVYRHGGSYTKLGRLCDTGAALCDIKGPGNVWGFEHVLRKAFSRRTLLRTMSATSILERFTHVP